ncbi:DNA-directed RNA polymerase subunit alpha C-terminal domain-containing protein [Desulfosporosinus sp. FKA]|uniref:DNA-directed RNA polymerase subunit alpha C-terminal domain-containing protein n=1 Tax=Desulfosporosinus sp. FKA TaxID=1969834 RepID=UPI000B499191|nr:DNA-directed RNA polymerase subunit alpha C-terminal domain-containing protein [Desulfosporosinus sp. FKA]
MVMEILTSVFACSLCQTRYNRQEDAEKCELLCAKLLKSPELSVLNLTSRAYNILKNAGIDTIDDVQKTTDDYLLNLKGFGPACLEDLHYKMTLFEEENALQNKLRE